MACCLHLYTGNDRQKSWTAKSAQEASPVNAPSTPDATAPMDEYRLTKQRLLTNAIKGSGFLAAYIFLQQGLAVGFLLIYAASRCMQVFSICNNHLLLASDDAGHFDARPGGGSQKKASLIGKQTRVFQVAPCRQPCALCWGVMQATYTYKA